MDADFIVVVYDISNDKRRTRLHNQLKNYGTPVQYSVFECLLGKSEVKKMKQAVMRNIRPRLDHVRFYFICRECQKKIEVSGRQEITAEKVSVVI